MIANLRDQCFDIRRRWRRLQNLPAFYAGRCRSPAHSVNPAHRHGVYFEAGPQKLLVRGNASEGDNLIALSYSKNYVTFKLSVPLMSRRIVINMQKT